MTYVGAEVGDVHLLGLSAHGGFVGEDGLNDEHVGEHDHGSWQEEVEDEDADVVANDL